MVQECKETVGAICVIILQFPRYEIHEKKNKVTIMCHEPILQNKNYYVCE